MLRAPIEDPSSTGPVTRNACRHQPVTGSGLWGPVRDQHQSLAAPAIHPLAAPAAASHWQCPSNTSAHRCGRLVSTGRTLTSVSSSPSTTARHWCTHWGSMPVTPPIEDVTHRASTRQGPAPITADDKGSPVEDQCQSLGAPVKDRRPSLLTTSDHPSRPSAGHWEHLSRTGAHRCRRQAITRRGPLLRSSYATYCKTEIKNF